MRFFTRQVVICLSHPQQERANKVGTGKPTPTQDLRVNNFSAMDYICFYECILLHQKCFNFFLAPAHFFSYYKNL
jgi:hypothetical protein